jgi:hypothetical protein
MNYYLIVMPGGAALDPSRRTMGDDDRGIEMTTRARTDRLEVHHPVAPPAVRGSAGPASSSNDAIDATDVDRPYIEPEQYGLRSTWQSEAVRIEAAEFLVATRIQEASRRRLARAVEWLRAGDPTGD